MKFEKGMKHPKAKLTEADVRNIRLLYWAGWTQVQIAKFFHINQSNVSRIITRQNWAHVEDEDGE